MAILLRTGSNNKSALELSQEILKCCNNNLIELGKLSLRDLQKVNGIGITKASTIAAALEIGRRRNSSDVLQRTTIKNSNEVANFLSGKMKDLNYEVFAIVLLNRANKIIHFEVISRGGITGTVADPRIILKLALSHGATSLILSHNHPSGNLNPSKADEDVTKKIKQAAALIDIQVLDHIIVSEEGYYSFLYEGKL
jgi:DNA repair protein RadC